MMPGVIRGLKLKGFRPRPQRADRDPQAAILPLRGAENIGGASR